MEETRAVDMLSVVGEARPLALTFSHTIQQKLELPVWSNVINLYNNKPERLEPSCSLVGWDRLSPLLRWSTQTICGNPLGFSFGSFSFSESFVRFQSNPGEHGSALEQFLCPTSTKAINPKDSSE